jgi:hypothetical protein
MKYLISLALLFSLNAAAIPPTPIPGGSKNFGGITTQVASFPAGNQSLSVAPGDTTYFALYAGLNAVGNGVTYPFLKNGVLYQVTAGKTAYCESITYRTGAASGGLQLLSATATFASGTATGSLTGPVYQCGGAGVYCLHGALTANAPVTEAMPYAFAASTWPGAQFADNTQMYEVRLVCHEI